MKFYFIHDYFVGCIVVVVVFIGRVILPKFYQNFGKKRAKAEIKQFKKNKKNHTFFGGLNFFF